MSQRRATKEARRRKRQAARESRCIPEGVLDDVVDNVELAEVLGAFDEVVTQRGWTFDDQNSDDRGAAWFYEPSYDDFDGPATTIWMNAEDNIEWVYVVLVGTKEGYRFEPEALLEHLDAIEAYRFRDPIPEF